MANKLEICIDCDAETGGAGFYEDSLYIDFDGPFCEDCYADHEAELLILKETYGQG